MSAADVAVLRAYQAAARAFADALEAEIGAASTEPVPADVEPYHQGNLPPGESRRSYLDKARHGAFRSSKTGRSVLCTRADWGTYVEEKARQAGRRKASPAANDTALDVATEAANALADLRRRQGLVG